MCRRVFAVFARHIDMRQRRVMFRVRVHHLFPNMGFGASVPAKFSSTYATFTLNVNLLAAHPANHNLTIFVVQHVVANIAEPHRPTVVTECRYKIKNAVGFKDVIFFPQTFRFG
jgi:hypothetical protein